MNQMRTIKVTGTGQLRVKPDTTKLTLTLGSIEKLYSTALKKSAQDTDCLKDTLSAFGFGREDLKTLDFSIEAEYDNHRCDDGEYRHVLEGYRYRHVLKVEFLSDRQKLAEILFALANCRANPEFRISYTVQDKEAAKNALLGKAVTDAAEKAKVLSAAAGITLGEIVNIDYSWGEIEIETRPMNRMMSVTMNCAADYDLDIEPDDIDLSDTVTVLWEIR